jgi:DNA-binding transcriptional LysR family regulator
MDGDIELRHLRYFMAVAAEQHFGRAALKLGIQQPPLSQQIQRLESMVGCRLFDRNPRGATLTSAGKSLLDTAQRLITTLSEGVEQARQVACGKSGVLTVGFAASLASTGLPSLIQKYRSKYPDVTLRLREMTTSAQLEALAQKQLDVGFMREKTGAPFLSSKPVFRERLIVVVPKEHRFAKRQKVKVRDLSEEPFVLFPREVGPDFHDRITEVCRAAGFLPKVVQEAIEWYTIVRMIGVGVGVTIAPESVLPMCRGIAIAKPIAPMEHTVVYMASVVGLLSPHVESFLRLILHDYRS